MAFYAQLGVPEVWRYDGNRAVFYRLAETGYEETPTSLAFPSFAAGTLTALLDEMRTHGQHAVLNRFRHSLRG